MLGAFLISENIRVMQFVILPVTIWNDLSIKTKKLSVN